MMDNRFVLILSTLENYSSHRWPVCLQPVSNESMNVVQGSMIFVLGLLCMLPARSCKSSPASLPCIPQAQHTGWRSTAFMSLVMVVVMAHGATAMTNVMNAVLLQQAGMSHMKVCTHHQQCVSVLAGLSAKHARVNCPLLMSVALCLCQLPFAHVNCPLLVSTVFCSLCLVSCLLPAQRERAFDCKRNPPSPGEQM